MTFDIYLLHPCRLGNEIDIYPLPTPNAWWEATRLFESSCGSLSFKKFPFDTATCHIVLDAINPITYNDFTFECRISSPVNEQFVSSSDIWLFVSLNCSRTTLDPYGVGKKKYRRLVLSVTLQRKHNYYIANIFMPTIGLFVLQLAILILDPRMPER